MKHLFERVQKFTENLTNFNQVLLCRAKQMTVKKKFLYEVQNWAEMGQSLSDFKDFTFSLRTLFYENLFKNYDKFKFIQ